MTLLKITRVVLCAVLFFRAAPVPAFETDQYNLPPVPLADVGDEVSDYAEENLRRAVAKVNAEIAALRACSEEDGARATQKKCGPEQKTRLAYLRSEESVARETFRLLGGGIPPFTNSGSWMESHQFKAQPARYKTSYRDSIFFTAPVNYLTISATVRLYGAEFGTDKIAHFFQQGYDYYRIYQRRIAAGDAPQEAVRKAVRWGQKTEHTYYGTLVSGVYSNADLFANFAGLKFYQGLTREITIGGRARPAVLVLKNGFWEFNETAALRAVLLKPFISNHLNEALNPSLYFNLFGFRSIIRRNVRRRGCPQWRARYPGFSQDDFSAESRSLQKWDGQDYGFKGGKNAVTIAGTCFEK